MDSGELRTSVAAPEDWTQPSRGGEIHYGIEPELDWQRLSPELNEGRRIVYFLGCKDPEMDLVVEVLESKGLEEGRDFFFATDENGNPIDARSALNFQMPDHWKSIDADEMVFVELSPDEDSLLWLKERVHEDELSVTLVDHHSNASINRNRPQSQLVLESSGVKIAILNGVQLSYDQLLVCAADHSVKLALSGVMYELDLKTGAEMRPLLPEDIMRSDRLQTIGKLGIPNDVFEGLVIARQRLLDAADVHFIGPNGETIYDISDHDAGPNFDAVDLATREAVLRHDDFTGVALTGNHYKSPEDPYRFFLRGHPSEELARTLFTGFYRLSKQTDSMLLGGRDFTPEIIAARSIVVAYTSRQSNVPGITETLFDEIGTDERQFALVG